MLFRNSYVIAKTASSLKQEYPHLQDGLYIETDSEFWTPPFDKQICVADLSLYIPVDISKSAINS